MAEAGLTICREIGDRFFVSYFMWILALVETDSGDLGVGEDDIRDDAPRPAARRSTGEHVEEDAVVVPCGVRELRTARDVPHGIDALRAGPVTVVDLDEAAPIETNPGALAPEIVGVGPATHRHQDVRAVDPAAVLQCDRDAGSARRGAAHASADNDVDSFGAEDPFQRLRDVGVLAVEQMRPSLHHRHRRSETPEHLRELASDVSAADDDEVLGQRLQLHHAPVVEPGEGGKPLDFRRCRPDADVDDEDLRPVALSRRLDLALPGESGMSVHDPEVIASAFEPGLNPFAPLPHDGILPRDDRLEVHARHSALDAQAPRGARHVRGARARHHGLRGRAAVVHAGTAEARSLDQQRPPSGFGEPYRERYGRLPRADDDRVRIHGSLLTLRRYRRSSPETHPDVTPA